MSDERTDVKAHLYDPHALAKALVKEESKEIGAQELLGDMREHPDLYYAEHVLWSQSGGVLPLSDQAWRRCCLAL